MLTPASASAAKNVAETPGWLRMPAPTSDTLPIWSSYCSRAKPMVDWAALRVFMAIEPSVLGRVNDTSVRPVCAADTFWTIMSMLTPARATSWKMAAALPGTSGTPTTVILASLRSCATPAMMACSMVGSSGSNMLPVTVVPVRSENELRTCTGMP